MDNKGVVLLSVIIILLTVALIGASLVTFLSSVDISARAVADEAKAIYLAEAGIAHAIYTLRTKADTTKSPYETIGPIDLGEGTYSIKIDINQALITSIGNVRGTKKTVQLQYRAL